jgi:methionyl-tRNA formyltransferase
VKILFWGTPVFAVPSLRALDDEGFEVVGVVTQPDRPKGRGRRLAPSPVKEVALAAGFPVLTPERPRGDTFLDEIRDLGADLSVVVAYGHILRREVLDVPPMGSINVHASVLPELRGAAPINWAIARGYETTGITVMRMAEAMDAGPILHIVEEPILADETASELSVRLSELGAEALVEALTLLSSGVLGEVEQDHHKATFAPKVDRETARVDWSRPAREIAWHIRGMDAVPGAWSELDGAPVKLFRPGVIGSEELDTDVPGPAGNGGRPGPYDTPGPGTVLAADEELGVLVAAGDGAAVSLGEVQPPGKRRMRSRDWIHGRGVEPGQRFA